MSDNEDPTLWLTIREEDAHIFFEIRDNGAGMTQEKADQILSVPSVFDFPLSQNKFRTKVPSIKLIQDGLSEFAFSYRFS